MRRLLAHTTFLVALALLAVPSFGPLLDHHFAEWQPGHRHIGLGPAYAHEIVPESGHAHGHGPDDGPNDAHPIPLLSLDAGPIAPAMMPSAEAEQSIIRFEPSSLFQLHMPPEAAVKQVFIPPPERPPQPSV